MTKNDILFTIALILSIWFLITGYIWVYWIALFIAYPPAIISFFIWIKIRKDNKSRNIIIPIILLSGLILSVGIIIYAAIFK